MSSVLLSLILSMLAIYQALISCFDIILRLILFMSCMIFGEIACRHRHYCH